MTHICVGKLTIIGSDNGLSSDRRQAIIWTSAGILLIGPLGTNFSDILIEIQIFSFKKMGMKISSAKWRPFCLGLNVLTVHTRNGGIIKNQTYKEKLKLNLYWIRFDQGFDSHTIPHHHMLFRDITVLYKQRIIIYLLIPLISYNVYLNVKKY